MATVAPDMESAWPISAPMPVAPPVTRAVRPCSGRAWRWVSSRGRDMTAPFGGVGMKSRRGGEEGAEVSTGVLALGKLDQDEQEVVAGQPGGWNDAEDAQGEEGTEF